MMLNQNDLKYFHIAK